MEFTEQRDEADSSSDDGEGAERNWEALSSNLSAGALAVLAGLGVKGPVEPADRAVLAAELTAELVDSGCGKGRACGVVNEDFNKQEYWESRFESEEEYDWLCTYPGVRQYLLPFLRPTDSILVVGCGNSSFSADLYDDGYKNIVNIDYSGNVVKAMAAKYSTEKPGMQWLEMNMLDLKFEDGSFDLVIDKAAMDAILVSEGDLWHPHAECVHTVHEVCLQTSRVLHDKGIYLQISFAQPHFRTKYLKGDLYLHDETVSPYSTSLGKSEVYPWTLQYQTISMEKGCLDSFLYIMKKGSE
jgi:SAM-dependent methyltransferase